jgi:predicted AlkP superfamily pyrophosphatase or phosphodiesterase
MVKKRRLLVVKMKTVAFGVLGLALLGCLLLRGNATPVLPRLILVVSVDQMRFDYLTRFKDLYQGGLRQLNDRGAVFSQALYRHSNTETGPGHAVILSGQHGSHSGIISNSWYDLNLRRAVNVVDDPGQRALGGKGRSASPANFLGFTLGDVLKQKMAGSKVVGVSMKDRAAILMAGRRADAAYWYETQGGNFVTSTYYMSDVPAWLKDWNNRHVPDSFAGKTWTRLLNDERLYEKYAGKDAVEGESDRKDIVFPHPIRGNPPEDRFYNDLRRTPFMDEIILGAAIKAMKAHSLGKDSTPDVLAVSFSATDVIGHTYGADSQEIMDQMLRLDQTLQKLFQFVGSSVGLENTLVILTADHGSLPLVEVLRAKGIDARRASPKELDLPVRQALEKRYPGVQGLIAFSESPHYYLDQQVIQKHGIDQKEVEAVISQALLSTGLVEKVYTQSQLLGVPPADDPEFQLFRNSFFQPRSPHIIVCPKKYLYIDNYPGGTGHGTPYEYDRHVPIVFMGKGIKTGMYASPCGPEDIAPTLAKMLGLDFPMETDSRLLTEMFP